MAEPDASRRVCLPKCFTCGRYVTIGRRTPGVVPATEKTEFIPWKDGLNFKEMQCNDTWSGLSLMPQGDDHSHVKQAQGTA